MKHSLTISALLFFAQVTFAQNAQGIQEYIQQYKQIALEEMVRSKIPASITLAQGIHESNCGKSPLAKNANNHFGIKCKEEWSGKKYYHTDDAPNECFRVYEHAEASYGDHSDFLATRPRYSDLFLLKITDYKSWAYGLKAAGYATNPQYPVILINLIEDYKLYEYDQKGLAMMEERQKNLASNSSKNKDASTVIISDVAQEKEAKHHHAKVEKEHLATLETKLEDKKEREEFLLNGVRATKAVGNEDPLKVAMEYNVDYSFVMMYNDLSTGDRFKEGENVFLQPKRAKAEEESYRVLPGESMRDIAQKFGVRMKDLYVKNQMKMNDQPLAGEYIHLKEKRSDIPRTMSYAEYLRKLPANNSNKDEVSIRQPGRAQATIEAPSTNTEAYEVQKTDTLYSIAKKFGTTVDQIKQWNGLEDNSLSVGQKLVVSK
jgi:LysM repeat protein